MELLSSFGVNWGEVGGWGVALGLILFMLLRFTSGKWTTEKQNERQLAAYIQRAEDYKEAVDAKDAVIAEQRGTIRELADSLKIVDDFFVKAGKAPRTGDTGRRRSSTSKATTP